MSLYNTYVLYIKFTHAVVFISEFPISYIYVVALKINQIL